jgi:hypothetical protein
LVQLPIAPIIPQQRRRALEIGEVGMRAIRDF